MATRAKAEPELEEVASFRASAGSFTTDTKGRLILHLIVPMQFKYDAMPVTDQPGIMLAFTAHRRVRLAGSGDDDE